MHFVESNGACADFRTKQPSEYLRYDGHIAIIIQPNHLLKKTDCEELYPIIRQCDIAFFNRFFDWSNLIDYANKQNVITIYGTDDYYDLGDKNPFGEIAIRDHWDKRCIYAARECDGVVVSTESLRDVYLQYNPNTYFILNMIDYNDRQWRVKKKSHKNIIIGYYGSPTHYYDLLEATPAITKLMKEFENVEFHYGIIPKSGLVYNPKTKKYIREFLTDNPTARKYLSLSKDMPKERVHFLEWKSIYQYGITYAEFDIAIAPLADTSMNNYKSPLKVLEPAAYDLPIVVSPIRPFLELIQNGLNGFIAKNTTDWYNFLRRLILSEKLRHQIGQALGYQMRQDFDLRKHYRDWYYVIQTIARKSGKPFADITHKPMNKFQIWKDKKWEKKN